MSSQCGKALILGIGNVRMGDEGVGVHVVRHLEGLDIPGSVECLDGSTGSLQLLEPMRRACRVVLVDATVDGAPVGTVRRLQPRCSNDYPQTLTAHDAGLKELLDAFHLSGDTPEVVLYSVSIHPPGSMRTELSSMLVDLVPRLAEMILREASRRP